MSNLTVSEPKWLEICAHKITETSSYPKLAQKYETGFNVTVEKQYYNILILQRRVASGHYPQIPVCSQSLSLSWCRWGKDQSSAQPHCRNKVSQAQGWENHVLKPPKGLTIEVALHTRVVVSDGLRLAKTNHPVYTRKFSVSGSIRYWLQVIRSKLVLGTIKSARWARPLRIETVKSSLQLTCTKFACG